jgi:DNA processing protein
MEQSRALLHLSLIEGIGPVTTKALLAVGSKPDDWYAWRSHDFVERCGLSVGVAQKIVAGLANFHDLERELTLLERHAVQWTTLGSHDYPELLAAIHAPPVVLYWRGENLFHQEKTLAFVGSRKAHRYAELVLTQLVPDVVAQGWIVVSGGAIGADSMAHRAAIQAGGRTLAVLGSGLLNPYPASNKRLFDDIVARGGAVVSCFPLETEAMPGLFPARNRVIAGLSRGCVVVQAAAHSGALITAHLALEQGREVFAVPGLINDELSAGCHALIQQGAKLICNAEDICNEFAWFQKPEQSVGVVQKENLVVMTPPAQAPVTERSIMRRTPDPVYSVVESGPTAVILKACGRPQSTDDVAILLGETIDTVQGLLFELQLAGKINQNFAGLWERLP